MRFFAACVSLAAAAFVSGCATISVYDTATVSERQFSEPQSALHAASQDYCDMAKDAGWSEGESTFSKLTSLFGDGGDENGVYWRRIGAHELSPTSVYARVEADAGVAARGLGRVNSKALALIRSTDPGVSPGKADVVEFERALIHARQAREAFEIALAKADARAKSESVGDELLLELDSELSVARSLADALASARMSSAIAAMESASS